MEEKDTKRIQKLIIIGAIAGIVLLYIIGIIVQKIEGPTVSQSGWGYTQVEISFNPVTCILKTLTTGQGRGICFLLIGLGAGIYFWKKLDSGKENFADERNFNKAKTGHYGTSGWMTEAELKANLDLLPIGKTTGTILGVYDGKIVSLPTTSRLNKHTAIYGASGTGKSRCFVRPQILQCVARGESVIITDPKGEIYADTAEFMRKKGYDVKMFNLVDPQYSDSWNCLAEIISNPDQVELMAQTFCDVIIKNTSGEKADHFWDNAELSLLKALCLYVALDNTRTMEQKNIGAVYEMITSNDEKKLTVLFDKLPIGHPAKQPWEIYRKAGDTVKGNVIIGLGSRIQVFQADIIRRITTYNEIDMEGPAKRKSAYFVIMSDQDSTLDFLSSLFFSFLFIKLVRYADVKGKDGKCDVFVNFILDEFPNIGQIPDFTKKLSTIRSRELRVAVIFQNVAQLQNRYPMGLWEEIIGNCDTQLFLGCTDQMTSKFISERTGEMTIEVKSASMSKKSIAMTQNIPDYKETESIGKRFVLTPDEVMRLESSKALVMIRGQKVLKVDKFDYSNHPGAGQFEHCYIRDYVPQWRASQSTKRFSADEEKEVIEKIKNNTYDFMNDLEGDEDMKSQPETSKTPLNTNKKQNTNFDSLLNSIDEEEEDAPRQIIGLDGQPRKEFKKKPSTNKLYQKSQSSDDIDF